MCQNSRIVVQNSRTSSRIRRLTSNRLDVLMNVLIGNGRGNREEVGSVASVVLRFVVLRFVVLYVLPDGNHRRTVVQFHCGELISPTLEGMRS